MSKYFDDSLAQPDRRPDIPTTSTAWPVLTSPEQREVRQTSLNELGLALARIEDKLKNGITRLIKLDEKCDGLSAKLDTLSGQLQPLAGLSVQLTNVATAIRAEIVTDHEAVLRRIEKLDSDIRSALFQTVASLAFKKKKHKKKGRKK